jgi:hypothetical protein
VASSTSDRRDEPATTAEQRNSAAMDGSLGVCCSSLRLQDATADHTRGGSFRRYLAARAQALKTELARRRKDVSVMGSAGVRQALQGGRLDEVIVHLVPVLLGAGVRLLDGMKADLRCTRVVDAPGVTHLSYDVVR